MLLDLKHARALRRQHLARKTPLLIFTATDVVAMTDALRVASFPTVPTSPEVIFVNGSFLACICHNASTPQSLICLHAILNHHEVPEQVFRHILTHELIHLIVAPREVDGKTKSHPPEFWATECALSPERRYGMEWVQTHLGSCLIEDRKNGCFRVKRDWRKREKLQSQSLEEIFGTASKWRFPERFGL